MRAGCSKISKLGKVDKWTRWGTVMRENGKINNSLKHSF